MKQEATSISAQVDTGALAVDALRTTCIVSNFLDMDRNKIKRSFKGECKEEEKRKNSNYKAIEKKNYNQLI